MTQHRQFMLGLFFSVTTVVFWGMLPIALKLSDGFTDPVTLTWMRFVVAGIVVLAIQKARGSLDEFSALTRQEWGKLILSGSFLIVNYTTFAWSLRFLNPGTAQLSFQVAPLILTLGGWWFLKERVHGLQWGCFFSLVMGLIIFFHPTLSGHGGSLETTLTGIGIILLSATAWSSYALLQKSLYSKLSSQNVLLMIYLYAMVVMAPFTHPSDFVALSFDDFAVLLFCCMNTLIAYGAFAQALRYWQTVQVGASIALTPVVSFIITELCVLLGFWPDKIFSAGVDGLSLFGMALVIVSAISVQIISARKGRKKAQVEQLPQSEATVIK